MNEVISTEKEEVKGNSCAITLIRLRLLSGKAQREMTMDPCATCVWPRIKMPTAFPVLPFPTRHLPQSRTMRALTGRQDSRKHAALPWSRVRRSLGAHSGWKHCLPSVSGHKASSALQQAGARLTPCQVAFTPSIPRTEPACSVRTYLIEKLILTWTSSSLA